MLTRSRLLGASTAALALLAVATPSASAAGRCWATPTGTVCEADEPGGNERPGSSTRNSKAPRDPCSYARYTRDIPKSSPYWRGLDPSSAGMFAQSCPDQEAGRYYAAETGAGGAPAPEPPTPAELAQAARSSLNLPGPEIQTAPGDGKLALVGLPVWVWLPQGDGGPGGDSRSTSAETKNVKVTATARIGKIRFDMGDGTTLTCTAPGTPYDPSYGDKPSPDCGHTYTRSSAGEPDDRYTITATATWNVEWSGNGESGAFEVTPAAGTASLRVGELQVVNRAAADRR